MPTTCGSNELMTESNSSSGELEILRSRILTWCPALFKTEPIANKPRGKTRAIDFFSAAGLNNKTFITSIPYFSDPMYSDWQQPRQPGNIFSFFMRSRNSRDLSPFHGEILPSLLKLPNL